MKKGFAVICLLLLLLQAIPVIPVLATDNIQITWLDEDKPQDPKLKETKNFKEFLRTDHFVQVEPTKTALTAPNHRMALPSPFLEYFAPPPNLS
jgi:hypothetical protein